VIAHHPSVIPAASPCHKLRQDLCQLLLYDNAGIMFSIAQHTNPAPRKTRRTGGDHQRKSASQTRAGTKTADNVAAFPPAALNNFEQSFLPSSLTGKGEQAGVFVNNS
jgi:hypothetical protein